MTTQAQQYALDTLNEFFSRCRKSPQFPREEYECRLRLVGHRILQRDKFGAQLIVSALIQHGCLEELKALRKTYGARVDLHAYSDDPLHKAVQYRQQEVLDWLLFDSGQHYSLKTADRYVLKVAVRTGQLAALKSLRSHAEEQASPSGVAVFQFLKKFRKPAFDVTFDDNILIRLAASENQPEICQWLVLDCGQTARVLDVGQLDGCLLSDVTHFLARLQAVNIPLDAASRYWNSPICRTAIEQSMVTSTEQLERLLTEQCATSVKRRRL